MTAPPLPASPCVRVRLDYVDETSLKCGQRLFFSYSGSAPTAANCATLAADIAANWSVNVAGLVNSTISLSEVDVLDIATDSGLSGQWEGSSPGSLSGSNLPMQVAVGIEFDIARRYRGGKPRTYLPPPTTGQQATPTTFNLDYITSVNTGWGDFMSYIQGLSIGAMGTLQHVNLSYYKGFHNVTNSSGRTRAVPTYRDSALLDSVNGYAAKVVMASQRRRRTSTTF